MFGQKAVGFRYHYALVGFGGDPTLWWMRFLKKGFYHCVIAIGQGEQWILIDPLVHYTDLIVMTRADVNAFLKKQGYKTLLVPIKEPQTRSMSLTPYTCVETVKRFTGLRNPWIFTPYQLYQSFLKEIGKKSLT